MTSPVHTAAYRSSHATSALSGVPSGPYAEPTRLVDLARLPPLVRSRLLMSIGEHASPAPLAEAGVHRPPLSGRTLAALLAGELPLSSRRWAFVSLAIAFVSLAVGFGRSLAPVWQAPLVATALVAALVLFRAARAAGVGPGHVAGLRPGVSLFPLDVVAIDGSSARVTPLGGVRSAALRERGDEATLDLSFHDGTHHRFEVRGAEVARLRHGLARSQSLLERLTFGHALDDAMANDLFFELRGRDGFADVLPDPRIQRARRVRGALLALATFGAGLGVFALRNARSDDIVWTDTVRSGRYDRYLEATEGRGRYTDAARDKIRRAALDVERAGDERSGAPSGDGRRAEPARVA
ncbi:MAG: hypothetical protein JNL38_04645, partial [Myxococcales bacterium]|nr:hypothetical protein [Myxococcales bacterium]